jgi:superfamily I DNA/RNA helicase
MKYSQYQLNIFNWIKNGNGNAVIDAKAGAGKCLGKNTPILMYDGSIKMVQDIIVGDLLMGDDSLPRKVFSVNSGKDQLYKIIPQKGNSFICNSSHILTLKKYIQNCGKNKYEIIDIELNKFLLSNPIIDNQNGNFKLFKLKRSAVEFPEQKLEIDPYIVGLWLGDGHFNSPQITHSCPNVRDFLKRKEWGYGVRTKEREDKANNTFRLSFTQDNFLGPKYKNYVRTFFQSISDKGEKYIPNNYLINSRKNRLALLAGLMDSDGSIGSRDGSYTTKDALLKDDILYLCRSLGFAAYSSVKICKIKETNFEAPYFRISISGDFSIIPTLSRKTFKRKQIKDALITGFKVQKIEYGNYYGFTIDGNGRFLLGDFTITHNTSTLVKSLDFIDPNSKILFLAYNKLIADELRTRVASNIDVKTLHSLGWSVIHKHVGSPTLDNKKTYGHIKSYFDKNKIVIKNFGDRIKVSNNIRKLIEYFRYAVTDSPSDELIDDIISKFSITILNDEHKFAVPIYQTFLQDQSCYDFADMLFEPLYRNMSFPKYDWVFLDEVQDVSAIQKEMFLKCMHPDSRFVACGDPAQCLLPNTMISTPDGPKKIQDLSAGDKINSYYNSGYDSGTQVEAHATEIIKNKFSGTVYTIETESGKTITGTANHITFANYSQEFKSNLYCVYLMFREDMGYRIGLSKTCGSKSGNNFGFRTRLSGEGGQKIWVLKTYESEVDARLDEILFSLKYSIPTTTFNVHAKIAYNNNNDYDFIKRVYSSINTYKNVEKLFSDLNLYKEYPHFISKSVSNNRKSNICITLCVRRNTKGVYHEVVAHVKANSDQYNFLIKNGYNLTKSKRSNFRLRIISSNFAPIQKIIDDLLSSNLFEAIEKASLSKKTLNFCPLSHVRKGMIIYSELDGKRAVVDKVKKISSFLYEGDVYDINLNNYHNYAANGILVHNCLYSFRGASKTAFRELQDIPNTTTLPLSISYRCGKKIVEYAQKLVPDIEHFPSNPDGEVVFHGSLNNVKYGDVILCRTNAPLAALANKLLQEHKKVTIIGNDFAEHLQDIIESSRKSSCQDLFVFLNEKAAKILKKIVDHNNCVDPQEDPEYVGFVDKSTTIKMLANDCKTVSELLEKIKKIFSLLPDSSGITLSTVHKFKGRESDNIFIVEPQLIPFPYYLNTPDSIETEKNIDYVARTRAKLKLEYITDWSYEGAKKAIQSVAPSLQISVPRDSLILKKKGKKKKNKHFLKKKLSFNNF